MRVKAATFLTGLPLSTTHGVLPSAIEEEDYKIDDKNKKVQTFIEYNTKSLNLKSKGFNNLSNPPPPSTKQTNWLKKLLLQGRGRLGLSRP